MEALENLERVIRNLAAEMATWRRRALRAEAEHSELGVDHDVVASREKIVDLEQTNADLESRLTTAGERVERMVERLRFLEEQVGLEEQAR